MQHTTETPLLRMRGISKSFGGARALHRVDLTVSQGEVVALVGENGAGKSTLARIAAGIVQPDAGCIELDGQVVAIDSAAAALARGIALIHQELTLADNLDVASNVLLGREPHTGGCLKLLARRRLHDDAARLTRRVGLDVPTTARVSALPAAQRQLVEVARALALDARVLLMDEPTSSLSVAETGRLLELIGQLRAAGRAIVFVSHRLDEVLEVADRIVVLRDGLNAGELTRAQASRDGIVHLMVGREITAPPRRQRARERVVLAVSDLRTRRHPLHPLGFEIHAGEIVGLAGLVGAGRSDLAEALFGLTPPISGVIEVNGAAISPGHPGRAIAAGLGLVPEDRARQGLILEMTAAANVTLAATTRVCKGPFISRAAEEQVTRRMADALAIRMREPGQPCRELSGGNQQKIVLARWLLLEPEVLILDEPTRGIDIGAKQEIYRLIGELGQRGVAVLMISSEMEEILMLSDRVLVMSDGRLTGELRPEAFSEEAVMRLATKTG